MKATPTLTVYTLTEGNGQPVEWLTLDLDEARTTLALNGFYANEQGRPGQILAHTYQCVRSNVVEV